MSMRASSTTMPRMEVYQGTTGASGDWTVVFPTPYPTPPHVNPVLYPTNDNLTVLRVTAVSNTGFTCKAEKRAGINLLGTDVLLLSAINVVGQEIRAFVFERIT